MSGFEIALLVVGGAAAGVLNTLAGGGSLLTVPLLVLVGLPGTVANGTNRVGILLQSLVGVWRFRAEGVSGLRNAVPLLAPVAIGSMVGAAVVAQLPDALFERIFGVVMMLLLIPMLRGSGQVAAPDTEPWKPVTVWLVFFGIGLYGGAIQAGVGIVLLFALTRSGLDLVRANAFKLVVVSALAAVAVPVFVIEEQVSWAPALVLSVGYAAGAAVGARLAVRRGERVIRPVLIGAVVALSGRMLGVY